MDFELVLQDDVELEHQLIEIGNKLSNPPRLTHDLLLLLDQAEKLLYEVCQSPKISMLHALKPSIKALIQDDLLRHSDVDVKVAVASCISEIMRITAPDAAYDNDQMRDVFQLIVSSFEDLADQSSRSYIKRTSILETVSKVRSYVIMLNLKCDGMIVEMFEHFLRSVRDYHRGVIYSLMENIMILVLEEREEISVEMLKPLLATVKKHNEGVLPIAQKLGADVLKKSAEKLKPYLMPALTALGDSLDSYTEIVSRICKGTTAATKRDDENASWQQREVKRTATIDSSSGSDLKLQKQAGKKAVFTKEVIRPATIDLSSDSDPEPQKQAGKTAGFSKEVIRPATIDSSGTSSKRKCTPVKDKESETIKYDKSLIGKKVKVWWREDKMYYEGVIESFNAAKKKHKVSYVDGDEEYLYLQNQTWEIIQEFSARDKDKEMGVSPKFARKPAKCEGNFKDTPGINSKRKSTVIKDKKSETIKYDESLIGKKVKVWWREDKMYYEGVIVSFNAAKKKHKVSYVDGDEENLYLQNQTWEIIQEFSARDKDKEMGVFPKFARKPAKGEGNFKDTSGINSKRKSTVIKDKESDTIEFDESLVGKKIKVWWPEDKMYYECVIESYDAAKKKHKVLYVDGVDENLYLKNERWAIIQNFSARDKEYDTMKYDESLVKRPDTIHLSSDSDV